MVPCSLKDADSNQKDLTDNQNYPNIPHLEKGTYSNVSYNVDMMIILCFAQGKASPLGDVPCLYKLRS